MANKKFEEMLEYVINGEQAKAESLFHELIVDMSREIYENMFDEEMKDVDIDEASDEDEEDNEEEMDENVGGDAADDMMQDVSADAPGDDSMSGDDNDDIGGEEGSEDDRLTDLEDEVASLKAEFEKIMGGEAGEEEHGDMDMDMDMGDEMDDEEKTNEFAPAFEEEIEEIDLSPAAMMREYVDKVGEAYKGGKVASSSEASGANTKSIVAKKNDMGGTTANIAKGGEGGGKNDAPGAYSNKTSDLSGGNVNVPGAKNATKLNKEARNWDKANDSEDGGTNKKSLLGK